jgi:hypothetical protein
MDADFADEAGITRNKTQNCVFLKSIAFDFLSASICRSPRNPRPQNRGIGTAINVQKDIATFAKLLVRRDETTCSQ